MRYARSLLVGSIATAASGLWLGAACSSVPDVVYRDGESEGGLDAREDQRDASRPQYACPDKPPPTGEGTCCGDKLCPNCKNTDDCQKCEGAGCRGDMASACCRRNPPQTDCKPFYDCGN